MCVLCEWQTHGQDLHPERSIKQHFTLAHKEPIECMEMTCEGMYHTHNLGDPFCSYQKLDPIDGLVPQNPTPTTKEPK
jgi:hypothetical protein